MLYVLFFLLISSISLPIFGESNVQETKVLIYIDGTKPAEHIYALASPEPTYEIPVHVPSLEDEPIYQEIKDVLPKEQGIEINESTC